MKACTYVLFAALLAAGQVPEKPAGFVTDSAKVLSEAEIRHLSARCARMDKAGKAQVAIVTIVSLVGEPIDKVSIQLFRK